MLKDQKNYFILTGAMGGGKSTILDLLQKQKTKCVSEPARQILYEQRLICANGVPERNSELFTELMLSRATRFFMENINDNENIIFDRGIPDLIAYAELFQLDTRIYYNASTQYRYNNSVFWFKGWKEIYQKDDERKMSYEQACEFGERTLEIYKNLGYDVIEVPKISCEMRTHFILEKIMIDNNENITKI
jgi:predicted ATPase